MVTIFDSPILARRIDVIRSALGGLFLGSVMGFLVYWLIKAFGWVFDVVFSFVKLNPPTIDPLMVLIMIACAIVGLIYFLSGEMS